VQDAVNCFFNNVNFSIEVFNGASHLSQTSMWAEALQVRLVNRAVVPLAIHVAFDLARDRFQRFHRQYSVIARKGMTLHFGWLLLCKNCRHRVQESSMTLWPDHLPSGNQIRF
jgi:hypothetical protein